MKEGKKRFFTGAELEEMGTPTVDLIQQAIDDGELEKAKKLARRMFREFSFQHDAWVNWITTLSSYIYRHNGDEAVFEAVSECLEELSIAADAYRSQDPGRQAQMLAAGLRAHLTPVVVEEDDEKFTVMMSPCGSGGKLISNKKYETSKILTRIKKPQRITFGRSDFPIYCANCAIENIVPMEKTGYPIWVTDLAEELGETPCKLHIYKDPDRIPARYYERFGLKKPAPKSSI
ncbi:MAG: hypothetical protein PHU70_01875 [Dehalococcoidia bacterium]|nr:hypothetical protein [Dehalococcoidia bacterium]MDD5757239.1 hypothetical protein [bacterium]